MKGSDTSTAISLVPAHLLFLETLLSLALSSASQPLLSSGFSAPSNGYNCFSCPSLHKLDDPYTSNFADLASEIQTLLNIFIQTSHGYLKLRSAPQDTSILFPSSHPLM